MTTRLRKALTDLTTLGSYATCCVLQHEDDQKPDFWYYLLIDRKTGFPGQYVNFHGAISAQFLLDPVLASLDVQALFTLDNRALGGDVTCHFVGHGKLHLPGIANSSGMKYGIVDIENSIKQFVQRSTPSACPIVNFKLADDLKVTALPLPWECDCGGRKAGYANNEPWGHAQWCKIHEKDK